MLAELIKEKAYALGFDLIGIAPASRAPHADAYSAWVEAGYAASMGYMQRDPACREDPRQALAGAQSVVVVGLSYYVADPPAGVWNDPSRGRVARYAWGLDYHDVMLPRLHLLADFVGREARQSIHYRACVDTGPLLERDYAAQAGLGFVGKNTCIISPLLGSYLFLGELLVDQELEYDPPVPAGDNLAAAVRQWTAGDVSVTKAGTCGACTRCLAVCPTHAFPAPYVLNSNRCISYLTIELKGSIPLELRPLMGSWIFGCDECQSVCPWPRRFSRPTRQPFLRFDPDRCAPRLLDLIELDEAAFRARFGGTPVMRARRRGLLRNVAVALGNSGDPQAVPVLEQALDDPETLIREHAAWAITRIRSKP